MQDDPTDRGQARTRSALTLNSSELLPDWWTLLAAEMDRLMRLLPPEGHTAEMIGARSKAAGKYFAERYRNRPEVVGILRDVVTQVVGDSDKFPPPAELVKRIDARMMWDSGAAERETMAQCIALTMKKQAAEREAKNAELRRRYETDPEYRARHEAYMARLRTAKPAPRISSGPWSEPQTPEQRRVEAQQVRSATQAFRERFDNWKPLAQPTP